MSEATAEKIDAQVDQMIGEIVPPTPQDAMPYEIATSMLTKPGVKMSNRMRKNCMAARQLVYTSSKPFVRPPGGKYEYHGAHTVKSLETKITERMTAAKWLQLHKWLRRTNALRMQVQAAYLKLIAAPPLEGDSLKKTTFYNRAKAALELRAAQLDVIIDAAMSEIENRNARTSSKDADAHLHPRRLRGNKKLCLVA